MRYKISNNALWLAELVLGAYAAWAFVYYFMYFNRLFSFFLLMYAIGFLVIGWLSRPQLPKSDLTMSDSRNSPDGSAGGRPTDTTNRDVSGPGLSGAEPTV